MLPDQLPVFFIVGRGRSGSTLLRSLFDAHPQVKIPLESRFVQYLLYHYGYKEHFSCEEALQAVGLLAESFEPPALNEASLTAAIRAYAPLSFSMLCKLIYLHTHTVFPKEEILLLGDKNPRYSFFIPGLMKLFPEAKFVFLLRDYRDNVLSVGRAGKGIGERGHPVVSLGRWRLYNQAVLRQQRKHPGRFVSIRFEDLISDPETELRALCGFLQLPFRPDMLQYQEKVAAYGKQDPGFSGLHGSLQTPFNKAKVGEWKHALRGKDLLRCEVLAGRLAEGLGYAPSMKANSLRRLGIYLLYGPVCLLGQLRFLLKMLLYRSPFLMRIAYRLIKIRQ
ncbi:MAG: hypothetical protein CSA96_02490 [Bacteroidetes bacterium]|nr:MAG: hypothetical protein CSA96_02490 [Bacteroidota bacterium]